MRASEFVTEGSVKLDQDTIDLVKMLWDEGKKSTAIAAELGLTTPAVDHILGRYYKSRPGVQSYVVSTFTDNNKFDIVSSFLKNNTTAKIANEYSVDGSTIRTILKHELGIKRYNTIMTQRKATPGVLIKYKITPEMLVKMRELYAAGKTLGDISDYFDNVITLSAVDLAMRRQPDYAEIRATRDDNTRKVKHSPIATTTKTRSGIGDNQGLKGPKSRHTSGVHWPKYG
jgi:predicted transcriptional regulator